MSTEIVDGPVTRTEEAAGEAAVRFLLDGLGIGSITDLKEVVDLGLYYQHMRGNGFALAETTDSGEKHECQRCGSTEYVYVDYGGCSNCRPHDERDAEDLTVLGLCTHGVDLDRDFCSHGCRV